MRQTQTHYEIIVVDDGSNDGTKEILKTYTDERLHTFYLPQNSGPAHARNFAVSKSKGELLAFIDSDCTASDIWLEELTSPFADDASILMTTGKVSDPPNSNYWEAVNKEPYFNQMSSGFVQRAIGCNMAIRRSFLDEHPFDEKIPIAAGEDTDLCFFCVKNGHKIFYNHKAQVVHYPRNTFKNSLSQYFYYGFYTSYVRLKHHENPFDGIKLPLAIMAFIILSLIFRNILIIKISIILITIYLCAIFYMYIRIPGKTLAQTLIYYPGFLLRSMSYSIGVICFLLKRSLQKT